MNNPFQELADRLSRIETLLADHLANTPGRVTGTEPELLDVAGAAEFLRLSTQTIYDKVHSDTLPYVKQGNRLYFFKDELVGWLKSARRPAAAEVVPPVRHRRQPKTVSAGEGSTPC